MSRFQVVPEIHHKILDIGQDGNRLGRATVGQFVGAEFAHIDDVEKDRSDITAVQYPVAWRHIAEGDCVQLGGDRKSVV